MLIFNVLCLFTLSFFLRLHFSNLYCNFDRFCFVLFIVCLFFCYHSLSILTVVYLFLTFFLFFLASGTAQYENSGKEQAHYENTHTEMQPAPYEVKYENTATQKEPDPPDRHYEKIDE